MFDNPVDPAARASRSLRIVALPLPLLRRLRSGVPTKWLRLTRHGFARVGARLPRRWQARLDRFVDQLCGQSPSIDRDYTAWVALYQQLDATAAAAISADIASFIEPPLISVLMPVFNPQPEYLRAAINSVQNQLYPWWELCIADDASTDPAVAALLRELQAQDPRIKVAWRQQNGHISAASNSALALASGTFLALLDHDDLLSSRALYEVAATLRDRPDVDIIFSDEDHVDDAGRRSHPYFKPGWNPELILGQNLISHLGVFRRSLVEQVGGFRPGFEGSQDYDLALRVVAQTTDERIVHIPKVLYHWRQGGLTRTFSEDAQDNCVLNARRALQEFVVREADGVTVRPAPVVSGFTRVSYPVPTPEPLISVVIVASADRRPVLRGTLLGCIDGLLRRTQYPNLEILLACRRPEQVAALRQALENAQPGNDRRVRVLHHAAAVSDMALANHAAGQALGSLILLLNPSLVVDRGDWLQEMISHAGRPRVGAVGAKLVDSSGHIHHGGYTVSLQEVAGHQFRHKHHASGGYFGHLQLVRNVTAVSSDCLMVRRDAFLAVGGLDDQALSAAYSDVDLCLKLMASGYRNIWTPHAALSYQRPGLTGLETAAEKSARFGTEAACMRDRWADRLRRDPYWNPNLSVHSDEITLAFPPRLDVPRAG